jgi:hypothetical protein
MWNLAKFRDDNPNFAADPQERHLEAIVANSANSRPDYKETGMSMRNSAKLPTLEIMKAAVARTKSCQTMRLSFFFDYDSR